MRNTRTRRQPQKLAAWRTWVPPHHLGSACATHLGTFAYSLARPAEPPSATKTKTTLASSPYLNIWDAGWYQGIYKEWYPPGCPARRRVRILQLLGVHAPPLNDQR